MQLVSAKLDANKTWRLTDADGMPVNTLDSLENAVIYLEKAHLPRDLTQLSSLPKSHRLLLRDGKSVFELSHSEGLSLKAGGASIPVSNYRQLHDAIWHFKSPWKNGPVRVLGLNDTADNALSLRKGVDTKVLLNSPHQLKEQTVVLAGPVENGVIKVAGKKFSLQDLSKQADEFDISFIMLETRGKTAPKKLANRLDQIGVFDNNVSTGEFLARLHEPDSLTSYRLSASGKTQTLISRLPKTDAPKSSAPSANTNAKNSISAHVAIHGALVLRPNEQRQRVLDEFYFFGIPSWLLTLYIMGFVFGLWAWQECCWVWNKLWPTRQSSSTDATIGNRVLSAIRFVLLLLIFVPLIGIYAAIFKALRFVFTLVWGLILYLYAIVSWPFRRLMSANANK